MLAKMLAELNIDDLDSFIAYRAEALSRDFTVTELSTLLKSLRDYLYHLAVLPHRLAEFKQRPITIEALGLKVNHELALKQANIETVGQFLAHEKQLTWPEIDLLAARIRFLVLLMVWAEQAQPSTDEAPQKSLQISLADEAINYSPPIMNIKTKQIEQSHDIALLNLSTHPFNALKRARINTIEQLVGMSDADFLAVRYLRFKSLIEIREKLAHYLSTHSEIKQVQQASDIVHLNLSLRSFNALKRARINTIEQLMDMGEADFLAIRNLGQLSLAEIKEKLANYLANPQVAAPPIPKEKLTTYSATPQAKTSPTPVEIAPTNTPNEVLMGELPIRTPIEVLDLSKRAYNCLYRAHIITVEQLTASLKTDFRLLEVRNLGKQTLAEIREKIALYEKRLISLPVAEMTVTTETKPSLTMAEPVAPYIAPEPMASLLMESKSSDLPSEESQTTVTWMVEQWFAQLTKRELQVIRWRYGFDNEILTLSQVGERLRLTRERVRQIQTKALRKLNKIEAIYYMQPMMKVIHAIFAQNDNIVHESELVEAIKRAMSIGPIQPLAVIQLRLDLQEELIWNKKLRLWMRGKTNLADEIITVQANLFDLVEQNHAPIAISDLLSRFRLTEYYKNSQNPLSDEFVLTCLQAYSALVVEDDTVSLEKWTRNGLNEIILALRELGEPSHFETITTCTNSYLAPHEQIMQHNVHAKMGRMPEVFVRVGSGIFGLKEWELHDDNNLGEAAYRVLKNAGKPLHQKVIRAEVFKTWQAGEASVNAALYNNQTQFILLGESVFSLVAWEQARAQEIEPQLPFCGAVLPDRVKQKDTFLESILVAQAYLKQRPRISEFLSYMLQWAGQDTAMSEWQKQSILNSYYLVGLIPYTFHFTGDNSSLVGMLPELSPVELRDYCLQNLTRRLAAMPEFWWAIQSYKSSTATDLAIYFAPYYPLNDIANRLKLLANLGVMKFLPDRRYQLTPFGYSVAAKWLSQPQSVVTLDDSHSLANHESWENDIELW